MSNVRVVLAQMNATVGDLQGNALKIIKMMRRAKKLKADIIAFPELAITGYPPEDLLLKPHFIEDNVDALNKIVAESYGITAVTGFVDSNGGIYNAAAIISDGELVDVYHKSYLPNYGVFDEYRYFKRGNRCPVYSFCGIKIGVNICEDIWQKKSPAKIQALNGAGLIININASPYHVGKVVHRENFIKALSNECNAAVVYTNLVGGQDELVFDGSSFIVGGDGNLMVQGKSFKEDFIVADIDVKRKRKTLSQAGKEVKRMIGKGEYVSEVKIPAQKKKIKPAFRRSTFKHYSENEEIYSALVLGTRDYVEKNGFNGVVIGMSGGVDSALVATIAVDAIGKESVHGLFMPSMYTSVESYEDAFGHAENLGINITEISIKKIYRSYIATLKEHFIGLDADITEENLQARIRGNLLMAFSNKFRWLVLTTGNKSEMSVGYATLYGDMAGGFAVIKDVPKTLVYKLCEWRNWKEGSDLIPDRILWKDPTAELKPDQRDTDSLPPYPVLDPILKAYVEEDRSFEDILEMGCDVECSQRIIGMVDQAEYKRRQAPPGVKITPRAFGKDRRFPIINKYKNY